MPALPHERLELIANGVGQLTGCEAAAHFMEQHAQMNIGNERRELKQGELRRGAGHIRTAFLHGASREVGAPQMALHVLKTPPGGAFANHDMDGTPDQIDRELVNG